MKLSHTIVLLLGLGFMLARAQPVAVDTICVNSAPTHLAVPHQPGFEYHWSVAGGTIISKPDSNDVLVSWGGVAGSYISSLYTIDDKGCMSDVSYYEIHLYGPYKAGVSGPSKVCRGTMISLEGTLQSNFVWNGNKQKKNIEFRAERDTTLYIVALNDPYCANDTFYHNIEVIEPPQTNISYLEDTVMINSPVTLFYSGDPVNTIEWWYDDEFISDENSALFTFPKTGDHVIKQVVSDGGCTDTLYKYVFVNDIFRFHIPNAFTPNGDGVNDIFMFKGVGIGKFTATIANRWGEILIRWTEEDEIEGWDGTFKGEEAPTGGYVYEFLVENKAGRYYKYRGQFNLIR